MKCTFTASTFATLLLLSFFTGCGNHKSKNEGRVCEIKIDNYENAIFNAKTVFTSIDTMALKTNDSFILSQVIDMCVSQNYIYILDANHSLSFYDRNTGKMQKHVRAIGHGAGEYIMPKAICTDGTDLYLLHEKACNVYDLYLNFKKKIIIDLTALDFTKVDDGFLFCNLTPTKDLKRLVYTDNDGKIKDSYLPTTLLIDAVASKECFIHDDSNNVYFTEPTSDKLYRWNKNGIVLCYRSSISNSFGDNLKTTSEKDTYAYNTNWFKLKDIIVNSFLYNGDRFYNIYDTTTSKSIKGKVNTNDSIPFFPQWQWENTLYGVFNEYDEHSKGEKIIVTKFSIQ